MWVPSGGYVQDGRLPLGNLTTEDISTTTMAAADENELAPLGRALLTVFAIACGITLANDTKSTGMWKVRE